MPPFLQLLLGIPFLPFLPDSPFNLLQPDVFTLSLFSDSACNDEKGKLNIDVIMIIVLSFIFISLCNIKFIYKN
ncbi:conserved protein of unknown function [Xenorhabdus bovienii]|uniref:Uncharacterized protein n=1 Tax=Xenorhabdus bovienii TaxID=40576 RepID=A0A0B6XFI7_XENBV|nr:conserved protein of unknown function [Xenorhabdus bovienii]